MYELHRNYFHVPLVKHFLLHSLQFAAHISALTTFHPCYQTLSLNQSQPPPPPWVFSLEYPKAKKIFTELPKYRALAHLKLSSGMDNRKKKMLTNICSTAQYT